MLIVAMSNRLELGGWYPSRGEQSFGELRARFFVEYSNALQNLIGEIYMNNPDKFDSPRDVLANIIAGELDDELAEENEVDPDTYEREEWIDAQEDAPETDAEGADEAEADD